MGLNISGVAFDKNFQENSEYFNLERLGRILRMDLSLENAEQKTFESATFRINGNECYVYCCPTGTLVITNTDYALETYDVEDCQTVSFVLLESSNASSLIYTDGIEFEAVRKCTKTGNPAVDEDFGEKLPLDEGSELFGAIKLVLGKSFFDIGMDEPVLYFSDIGVFSNGWDD